MQKVFIDRTGEVFGILTLLECTQKCNKAKGIPSTKYLCRCTCGNTKNIAVSSLVSGLTKSCGCLTKEVSKGFFTTHGASKTSTYNSWKAMKERCYYKKNKRYKNYGGSGIVVCDRWVNSFENFLLDMGERPLGMTLDRKNPKLSYFKGNCRWVDASTQAYNKHKESKGSGSRVGISWYEQTGKWQVRLRVDGKQKHLGYFENEEEAIKVRENAEIIYRGENLK